MDMNYLVQRRINARKKYRRKVAITIALSVLLLILIIVGLIKVIMDEKKEKNAEDTIPGVTATVSPEASDNVPDNNIVTGNNESSFVNGGGETAENEPVPTAVPAVNTTAIPTATPSPTSVPKTVIALDAGHGGEDLGSTRQGLYEKDANLAIALFLEKELEEAGYAVFMVRDGDFYVENEERPVLASQNGASLYVSIHLNSIEGDNDATQGAEVWYADMRDDGSEALAQYIADELTKVVDTRNRGIKLSNKLTVLRHSDVPACLVECGFITSETERAKLFDPEYQKKVAEGICNGIQKFLPLE
ncbi:MAG: N-acetylmuramoyl-L-alanine amidase [Lachnospiraceae bacterium]|nr:N-acetylmuramoyl-L-alanine amidase [Lachnospiraceae bacterium]MBP3568618.1 N-acetylmuramoyl-L-alanine amidase [Lachnospiraceae bacterium]